MMKNILVIIVKSTNFNNIAVTKDRLKAAISKGVEASNNTNYSDEIREKMEDVSVQTALVKKIHLDTNTVEIQFTDTNDKTDEAYLNHPFLNKTMNISCIPDGQIVSNEHSNYIVPDELYCNVIRYRNESTDLNYLIIGFCQNKGDTLANECLDGDLNIQVETNKIQLNKDYIIVNCNDLIINGASLNRFLTDYKKLEERVKNLEEIIGEIVHYDIK